MARNYAAIERMVAETGFFSEYLPPCFSIDRFFLASSPSCPCDLIAPYTFTMSRFNQNDARRSIYIPEIGAYAVTRNFFRDNDIINDLITFSETSHASFSPILATDNSIMRHEQIYSGHPSEALDEVTSNYIENVGKKLIMAAGAKQVLKLDIANCYPSFYTHMIPAILLGVSNTEQEYAKYIKDNTDASIDAQYIKYQRLDVVTRQLNLNRTNGLLTGPLYSRIIAESMFARIDAELERAGLKFARYADDFEVYLYNGESKAVISTFTRILKTYGFTLNHEKTELIDFPYYVAENLEKIFGEDFRSELATEDIIKLFNDFLMLEKQGTKGAIRYLIKSLERKEINTRNDDLFKAYLLTVISNNERSLPKACSLLIKNKDSMLLEDEDVLLIEKMLNEHLGNEHDLEVIWLTYLLIEIENISEEVRQKLTDTTNELVHIMLIRKNVLTPEMIEQIKNKAQSWILLYELYSIDQITETEFVDKLHLNKNLEMYKKLKLRQKHFCYASPPR